MKRRLLSVMLSLTLLLGVLLPGRALALDDDAALDMIAGETLPEGVSPDDPMYFRAMHPEQWQAMVESDWQETGIVAPTVAANPATYSDYTPRALNRGETLRKGIDVSVYQGNIDWAAVAASGVEFAIIRVANRGWGLPGTLMTDAKYKQNIQGAREHGIKVGAYIYSQAITMEEGIEEARYLMNLLDGYTVDLPLVIDYEYAGNYGRLYNAGLSVKEATDICCAFCDEVQAHGYQGMVYANKQMLEKHMNQENLDRVWVAYWNTTGYNGDYEYWQFTSDGVVSGISGRVDLDYWFDPGNTAMPFLDVHKRFWYYTTVYQAYERGLVYGTSDTTFSPVDPITRGQLVTILYRMMGSPRVSGGSTFRDLTADWYRDAVTWAWQNNVVSGYSSTEFGPGDNIIRQDIVTILYRHAGSPAVTGSKLNAFSDAGNVAGYARDAVEWAIENGILNGSDNKILPRDTATRAEACAFLLRYQNYLQSH